MQIALKPTSSLFTYPWMKKVTFIGATAGDEMCNLYMMYFFPPGKAADYLGCGGVQAGNEITEGKFLFQPATVLHVLLYEFQNVFVKNLK